MSPLFAAHAPSYSTLRVCSKKSDAITRDDDDDDDEFDPRPGHTKVHYKNGTSTFPVYAQH